MNLPERSDIMDNSNLHHPYMERMESSQQLKINSLPSSGPRQMYASDMPSHTLRYGSMVSYPFETVLG